ncbi:MAG TPA: transcriptional repressor [Cyclobacteriaceae bacterium]|nr:transcriptional repressor [Cyclobacteriaceae bacterium]MCB9237705.1 transcriptional repressor [Flammeovirgaceae bacterium]MCB0498781.1 transcriptional repressor [Cyclobacteriaceae bacterium]MCO5270193.1 transcriptional repressor [Cyclobacteriaceae bacterium]MCW5903772.1 transcriptional repressor [Cyclobacteriaceae bacterium]
MRIQRQILKESNLRSTTSRSKILGLFLSNSHALSYSDIEKQVASLFDRVTVYRTLKSFLEKGIIHKIPDNSGGLKYALCSDHCPHTVHQHDHVHFKCTRCGQTSCLEEVEIPPFDLPGGYKPDEVSLLVQGTCSKCR